MKKIFTFILFLCATQTSLGTAKDMGTVGTSMPLVVISGEDGGKTTGEPWSSAMIKDKVHLLFYVDPDKRSDNEKMEQAISDAKFDKAKFASIAVINLDATWLPNAIIESSLEDKQKKYPEVTYVKDFNKILVKKWQLADDSYDVLVFNKDGSILFHQNGVFDEASIEKLLHTIKSNLK